MRIITFLSFLCIAFASFAQSNSWYKQIDATIGKYPVMLHLHKAGHTYDGYYYYKTTQVPVHFTGDDTTVQGAIHLTAFPSPHAMEFFTFTLKGSDLTGSWKKETNPQSLPLSGKETTGLTMAYVFTEGERKLLPKMTESPQATFLAAAVWPTGATELDAYLKKVILKMYDEQAAEVPIGQVILQKKEMFFRQYAADMKDVKPADFKETSFMYNTDQTDRVLLAYYDGKLATVARFSYLYSGGAHGNYNTTFHSFDLTNKKQLKLADVMTPAGQKQLISLLAKTLRSQFKLKPTDSLSEVLFENKITPNNNFYVTSKGIGFVYNPYEIAAYAVGEINLFIPFRSLQNGLQPAFQKLLVP
ncbi:MAG TPA: RsiV family protein [Flavisolibacter sp.]|jgi:hypothetical protein|nr:RsiV family protein [Flavisolibacter sp.]